MEEQVRRVMVKFEGLGYPRDALLKRLKEQMSMVSLSEILSARWSGTPIGPSA